MKIFNVFDLYLGLPDAVGRHADQFYRADFENKRREVPRTGSERFVDASLQTYLQLATHSTNI